MSGYFGLVNWTTKHEISAGDICWKGNPPSKHEMMYFIKFFNWKHDDALYSRSINELYFWIWEDNLWIKKEEYNNYLKKTDKTDKTIK